MEPSILAGVYIYICMCIAINEKQKITIYMGQHIPLLSVKITMCSRKKSPSHQQMHRIFLLEFCVHDYMDTIYDAHLKCLLLQAVNMINR